MLSVSTKRKIVVSKQKNKRLADIFDKYEIVPAPDGGQVWNDFDEAMKAAGSIEHFWTLTQFDYESGLKAFEFYEPSLADKIVVVSESIEDAYDQAHAIYLKEDPTRDPENLDYETVWIVDPDSPLDESKWDMATDMYALAGNHLANRFGWAVTKEPWKDIDEYYRW